MYLVSPPHFVCLLDGGSQKLVEHKRGLQLQSRLVTTINSIVKASQKNCSCYETFLVLFAKQTELTMVYVKV